jgi:hypothetical protein
MKKIIITFILLGFMLLPYHENILAQGTMKALKDNSSPLEASASVLKNQVDSYTFPFPGILTNHPLYFLKSFRDLILQFFIINPVEKIEFQNLQSDKFFAMSLEYLNKHDMKNCLYVLDKTVEFKGQAIAGLETAISQKLSVPPSLVDIILNSSNKQISILENMRSSDKNVNDSFGSIMETLKKQIDIVNNLKNKMDVTQQ